MRSRSRTGSSEGMDPIKTIGLPLDHDSETPLTYSSPEEPIASGDKTLGTWTDGTAEPWKEEPARGAEHQYSQTRALMALGNPEGGRMITERTAVCTGKNDEEQSDEINLLSQVLDEHGGGEFPSEISNVLEDYFFNGNSKDCEVDDTVSEFEEEVELLERLPQDMDLFYNEDLTEEVEDEVALVMGELIEAVSSPLSSVPSTSESNTAQTSAHQDDILVNGCGCANKCTKRFTPEEILESRMDCLSLDERCSYHYNHQHILLLGAANALCNTEPDVTTKLQELKLRERAHFNFSFRGAPVCATFFRYVFGCGNKKFKNVMKQFQTQGIVPKTHQNIHRAPKLAFEDRKTCVKFINEYAQNHALVLPGRIPSTRNLDLKILPSSMSKQYVYTLYVEACSSIQMQPVTIGLWYTIWKELCNNIVIQKPRTDLCHECQNNVTSIIKMRGLDDNEKMRRLQLSMEHLTRVQTERTNYKEIIASISKDLKSMQKVFQLTPTPPLSYTGTMHYSFDYAQQIHLPQSSQQVGPLFFLTGYKVALFGVAIEPIGKFVLYIIPESCSTGKGSNVVISLLHHFFENFGVGEHTLTLHADNCSGQNKNNYLMQYLCWRVITKRHRSIKISFLPVGHTKFSPDLYFGLFKKKFRSMDVNSLADVKLCCEKACPQSQSIVPVLVGSEDGNLLIKTYNWQNFFKSMKAKNIPNLLSYYHFETSDLNSGIMEYKKLCNDEESLSTLVLETGTAVPTTFPEEVWPSGLPLQRQFYLYDKIREFVHDDSKDVLCPRPQNISAQLEEPMQIETQTQSMESNLAPKTKAPRKCGICHQTGHDRRTCPNNK